MNLLLYEIKGRSQLKRNFTMFEKLIYSSKDPKKFSLTLKSLAIFIPSLVALLKVTGVEGVTELDFELVLDNAATFATAVLTAVSAY